VAPTNPHLAYLGTADGGVWKTTDDGVNWTPVFDKEPTLAIGAVAVSPSNPNVVYVGTGEANWALQGQEVLLGNGIYRSTDGGSSWTRASIPFASGYMGGGCAVSSLAVEPGATNILVAGVFCPGTTASCATAIIRSTDSGATWSVPSGLSCSQGSLEDEPPSVAFSPSHPSPWYATISATGGDAGVWRSTDSGASWAKKLNAVPPADWNSWSAPRGAVAVAPTDGNRVYAFFDVAYACIGSGCLHCAAGACATPEQLAQFWMSTNGGSTWKRVGGTNAQQVCTSGGSTLASPSQCWSTMTLAGSPTDPSTFYTGTLFPVKLTNDGANLTWSQAPIRADQHAYAFDSLHRLWIGNDGGAYRIDSESNIDTYDNLNNTLSTVQIYRLSVGSNGDITIATQDNGCDLYTPTTGWNFQGCGDGAFAVISALNPKVMYIAIQYMSWILKSTDGGQTWNNFATLYGTPGFNCSYYCTPFLNPFVEAPGTGDLLTAADYRVWRSPGGNGNWTAVSPKFSWMPGAIAVAPSNHSYIYAGSSAYSNVSQAQVAFTHGGGPWSIGKGCCGRAPVTDITVDPSNPSHAYLTTSSWPPQQPRAGISGGSQVMETTDGGANWKSIGSGLPAAPIGAIAVDWARKVLDVGTDVGVLWSADDGSSWHMTSSKMPTVSVQDLAILGNKLYAATMGRGVYWTGLIGAPPQNALPPTVSGTVKVGSKLTSSTGVWTGAPTSYSFQWFRCATSGGCTAITGATSSSYTLVSADAGHTMRSRVTARNTGGATAALSNPTAIVSA